MKDAILHAGKSYESVLKGLSGLEHANADRLIKEVLNKGLLNDLPELVRRGFANQVLMALPFLWNKLGGMEAEIAERLPERCPFTLGQVLGNF